MFSFLKYVVFWYVEHLLERDFIGLYRPLALL